VSWPSIVFQNLVRGCLERKRKWTRSELQFSTAPYTDRCGKTIPKLLRNTPKRAMCALNKTGGVALAATTPVICPPVGLKEKSKASRGNRQRRLSLPGSSKHVNFAVFRMPQIVFCRLNFDPIDEIFLPKLHHINSHFAGHQSHSLQ